MFPGIQKQIDQVNEAAENGYQWQFQVENRSFGEINTGNYSEVNQFDVYQGDHRDKNAKKELGY